MMADAHEQPRAVRFDPALADRVRASRSLGAAFGEYQRSIGALLLRETATRFGNRALGYLWAFIEPIGFILVFFSLRAVAGGVIPFGDNLALFLLTGVVVARCFLNYLGRMSAAISANKALLTYPTVQPLDAVIARIILESITYVMIVIVFFGALMVVVERTVIHDYTVFTWATLATIYLAASWGAFNAAAISVWPTYGTLLAMIKLPLFLTSAVFFLPAQLPPAAANVLWFNPILHLVEWYRMAIYLSYIPMLDRSYPVLLATAFLGAAFWLERSFRLKIATG